MSAWMLALVVAGMVAVAGCAMWVNTMGDKATEFLDFAERAYCYDSGFNDARMVLPERAPGDAGDECDRLYSDAYRDALEGRYDPPRQE